MTDRRHRDDLDPIVEGPTVATTERTCDLEGCELTFPGHAAAPLAWCSAAHRIADPRGGLRPVKRAG